MFKFIVKDAQGVTVLETVYKNNALQRASQPGHKLITVPVQR